ncbi:soluble quino protein glucose/sorbosone dehydrogenase [Mariannaea sp. PMI_226]|nr:soluble quino protein glucose/sorbosone dehydrogenase [Mariannaea sp. PMI_226]
MATAPITAALTLLALLSYTVPVSAAGNDSCSFDLANSHQDLVVADGWSYSLVANKLDRPRGILFDTEGALLIVDSGVGVVHLQLDDSGGTCLQVKKKQTLIKNKDLNHGIALSDDGRTLYASTTNEVYSWSYNAADVSVSTSSRQTLVTNMTNEGHTTRTILLSQKHPDYLVVSRGSNSNSDEEAADRASGHSQLRAFNITALQTTNQNEDKAKKPYEFLDGKLLGWGLRNSVGVAEHPSTGGIWTVENSVDNLRRHGKDIHQDNPGEELNFHGYLNGSSEHQGGNYGYPVCYTVWSTKGFPDLGDLTTGDQFAADEDDTNLITIQDDGECNTKYVPPELAFQAHTAPLDIKFNENGTKAFVTFHGSWDRDDPVGYDVSSIDFKDGRPVKLSDSMDAATPILSNPDISKCPNDCFRPVGLAWDSKGRLWFSSDSTGEIFVLMRNGTANDSRDTGSQSGDSDDSSASHFFPPQTGAVLVTIAALVMGIFLA